MKVKLDPDFSVLIVIQTLQHPFTCVAAFASQHSVTSLVFQFGASYLTQRVTG
jgi:hypothetical protein